MSSIIGAAPTAALSLQERMAAAKTASRALATATTEQKNRALRAIADGVLAAAADILPANELDLANGLLGKTVIHPSHVPLVQALHVVAHDEYLDATDIMASEGGGAVASRSGARMNEAKPHRAWARRTLLRADAFGVARPDVTFVDLLEASMK